MTVRGDGMSLWEMGDVVYFVRESRSKKVGHKQCRSQKCRSQTV